MTQPDQQETSQRSEKELNPVDDSSKILDIFDRFRFQVEKLIRELNKIKQEKIKLEQENQLLINRIDELQEKLDSEIKKSESSERLIIKIQKENDDLKNEINIRVEDILLEKFSGILSILPELSCLAGREPHTIQGLSVEHVLNHLREEVAKLFGDFESYPKDNETTIDQDGNRWIEFVLDEQNRGSIPFSYDWGNEKPLQNVNCGEKVKLRLLRHGWQTKNKILVRAVVTSCFPEENVQVSR